VYRVVIADKHLLQAGLDVQRIELKPVTPSCFFVASECKKGLELIQVLVLIFGGEKLDIARQFFWLWNAKKGSLRGFSIQYPSSVERDLDPPGTS